LALVAIAAKNAIPKTPILDNNTMTLTKLITALRNANSGTTHPKPRIRCVTPGDPYDCDSQIYGGTTLYIADVRVDSDGVKLILSEDEQ
jgi:hypothetical protein